jgi:hypothetical protein
MKKSVYISLLFLNLAFLGGCSSIVDKAKNMEDPLKSDQANEEVVAAVAASTKEVAVYFVRPPLILTAAQVVELYVDDKEVAKLQNAGSFETKITSGNYEMSTKVGLSLGLQGVCKFSEDFNLTNESYYFKVDYDVGLLCGEYEIVEISESEYSALSAE